MFNYSDDTDHPDIVPRHREETGPTGSARPAGDRRGLTTGVGVQVASDLQARLTGELEALRQCREWLERLDRGERVVVNPAVQVNAVGVNQINLQGSAPPPASPRPCRS